jgi:hypothetical protein
MKYRLLAAIFFGFVAVSSGIACLASWTSYQREGNRFITVPTQRSHAVSTLDRAVGLGVGTIIAGVCFLALISSPREEEHQSNIEETQESSDSDAAQTWMCPSCGEKSPRNFEKCWKCQRDRPNEV